MTGTGLLLDTHAAVWWWKASRRLGRGARQALEDEPTDVRVSVISALEITIKHRIGKFDDIGDPAVNYPRLMAANNFVSLAITESHAIRAGLLAGDHRDPFDRIIAAQALAEELTVVTVDPAFAAFGCRVLW